MWLTLTSQMLEAARYLHDEVQLINNDIKSNSILLTHSFVSKSSMVQIVIVDFGKCTKIENRRSFKLSQMEKAENMRMYPYMAQELIEGIANESPQTDIIYTAQVVLYCQFMTVKFSTLTTRNTEVLPTYWFIAQISTTSCTSNCKKGPSRPSIIIIIIVYINFHHDFGSPSCTLCICVYLILLYNDNSY